MRPESSFCRWLQQGEGIYWIKGKPGSGKSTLVKFITGYDNQNRRTLECLEKWAGSKPPRILSFYFWLADKSNNQNSFRGFLCHLLHQLLVDEPPESVSRLITAEQVRGKHTMENWDPNELETLLKSASHRTAKETPLCFFIDGLDECVGTALDRVVKMMQELALTPGSKIKICVSSRPEQKIENRFRGHVFQTLELHSYTEASIKQHVTNEFEKCPQTAIALSDEQEAKLTEKIVSNSQGVFLWAVVVTRKLCESIEFGDTFTQLEKQLEELPPNMTELYQTILERSDAYKGHRRAEAASYFRFALDHCGRRDGWCERSGGPLALEHFLPLFEIYHGHIQANEQPTMLRMRQRINHLCAGIIVVDMGSKVDFFHRTARDYLYDPSAKGILDQGISQLESFRLFADNILKYDHGNCFHKKMAAYEFESMMGWIREMDETSEADKVKFLRHIDEGMERYYATNSGTHHGNWVHEQAPSKTGNDQVAT
jgi:energy-coupling factor transporter ATP-binding protein EcfA2